MLVTFIILRIGTEWWVACSLYRKRLLKRTHGTGGRIGRTERDAKADTVSTSSCSFISASDNDHPIVELSRVKHFQNAA